MIIDNDEWRKSSRISGMTSAPVMFSSGLSTKLYGGQLRNSESGISLRSQALRVWKLTIAGLAHVWILVIHKVDPVCL